MVDQLFLHKSRFKNKPGKALSPHTFSSGSTFVSPRAGDGKIQLSHVPIISLQVSAES